MTCPIRSEAAQKDCRRDFVTKIPFSSRTQSWDCQINQIPQEPCQNLVTKKIFSSRITPPPSRCCRWSWSGSERTAVGEATNFRQEIVRQVSDLAEPPPDTVAASSFDFRTELFPKRRIRIAVRLVAGAEFSSRNGVRGCPGELFERRCRVRRRLYKQYACLSLRDSNSPVSVSKHKYRQEPSAVLFPFVTKIRSVIH